MSQWVDLCAFGFAEELGVETYCVAEGGADDAALGFVEDSLVHEGVGGEDGEG